MIFRLIFLGIIAFLGVYAYHVWMGPKTLRVPKTWMRFAHRHPDFAHGLSLRRSIGRLLLAHQPERLHSTLANVDAVLLAMIELIQARSAQADHSGLSIQGALDELTSLHQELTSQIDEKNDDALKQVRERLAASTADLKQSHRVKKQIDRELD